jgi:hypothetical protein
MSCSDHFFLFIDTLFKYKMKSLDKAIKVMFKSLEATYIINKVVRPCARRIYVLVGSSESMCMIYMSCYYSGMWNL